MSSAKLFFNEIFSYFIIQIFGIFSAKKILSLPQIRQQIEQQNITWPQFLISIAFATLIILLFLKFFKNPKPYKIFFGFLFFLGCFYTLNIWLPGTVSLLIDLILILFYERQRKVWLHNLIIVLTIVWTSVLLGLIISPFQAIMILLILSVYDVIAVFGTKHMIYLFKGLAEKGIVFALAIPKNLKNLFKQIPEFKNDKIRATKRDFVFLGTGDIALPMIFSISLLRENFWLSISTILGALFGLVFIHFFLFKKKRPLPALPPLTFGTILGWAVCKLILV
ncbi:hypothetical protein J7K86_01720 [bacterium]|nr:hypothetical protein [bacterium]